MPLAFSYMRFSSAGQSSGDSISRQTKARDNWLQTHADLNLALDQEITDAAKSAFRGANRKAGLGEFLALVNDGNIPVGSYLIIESLDRLSRQQINKSVALLLNLLDAGINVVTVIDGMVYTTQQGAQQATMSLMLSVAYLSRAAEESATKSARLSSAWGARRADPKRRLTSICPGWLRPVLDWDGKGDQFTVDEVRAAVVVRIYREYVAGDGYGIILRRLNDEGIPPITEGQPARPGVEHRWSIRQISRVLKTKAVMGERVMMRRLEDGKRAPTGERSMAYPEVVSPTLWQQAQAAHGRRSVSRDRGESGSLLAGLARCGHCAGIMVRSGPKHRPVMRCSNRYVNHTCKLGSTYSREQVELGLRDALSRIVELPITSDRTKDEQRIVELRAKIEIETDALARLYVQQARSKQPDAMQRAIAEVETTQSTLTNQLASAEANQIQRIVAIDPAEMQARVDALWAAASDDASSRAKLREIIRQYVEHAVFGDHGIVVLHLRQHPGLELGISVPDGALAYLTSAQGKSINFRDRHKTWEDVNREGSLREKATQPIALKRRSKTAAHP